MQDLPLWDESSLALLIAAARRQIRQTMGRWLAPHGLSPQQYLVLMVLRERKELSLRDLAESIWTDNPTASRIVQHMVGRGLVEHRPDPDHGRRLALRLSARGRRLAATVADLRAHLLAGMVEGLSEREQEALRAGLRKVMANVARLDAPAIAPRRS